MSDLVALLLLCQVLVQFSSAAIVSTATFTAGRFSYRDVNVTVEVCDASICQDSAPNLAVFMSHQTDWSFHTSDYVSGKLDLLATIVTTVGYPSNVHCYFRKDEAFSFEVDWRAFLLGQPNSVSIGTSHFCMGILIEELIEFTDEDGDNQFNPQADTIISRYDLSNSQWEAAHSYRSSNSYSLSTITTDGVIGLEWSMAPTPFKEATGFILTPNSTRLDLHITSFPFVSQTGTSRLALKINIVSEGGFDTSNAWKSTSNDHDILFVSQTLEQGYFEWAQTASAVVADTKLDVTVLVSNLSDSSLPTQSVPVGLIKAILGENVPTRVLYFSFAEATQPSLLTWESSVGYGDPPIDYPLADVFLVLIIFASLVVPALVVGVVIWYRLRKRNEDEQQVIVTSTNTISTVDNTPLLRPANE